MKKSANKTNYMKGAAILLITMCLLPFGSAKAQTIQSAQYKLTTCQGINVVVRESATGTPVISFRKNESTYTSAGAHFVYGDLDANTAKEFVIPDTLLVLNNRIRYFVNDMRVVGDMCYFCGVREYVHGEVDPETGLMVIDSVGILGRFRLDPSGFGTPVKFDLRHFSKTKSLDRMVVCANVFDTVIAMTGMRRVSPSLSCLMVVRKIASWSLPWEYGIWSTANNPLDVFTDIAADADNITIASYGRNNDGKNHFCLRKALKYNLFGYSIGTIYDSLYTYSTNKDSLCISFVRPGYAEVRLSAVPWKQKAYAAFSCSLNACDSMRCQTAMCEINTGNMMLNNIQIVQKMYGTPHTLVDTKYLYKTDGDESTASVALLHLTEDDYHTVVEYPRALVSSYAGAAPRALVQRMEEERMQSVSTYSGNDVRLGGMMSSSLPVLTYIQETLPVIHDGSMCMQNGDADILISGPLSPGRSKNALVEDDDNLTRFSWGLKTSVPMEVNADNICRY